MTTTSITNTATHERRAVEQFTLDADDFAASSIMNDADALDAVVVLASAGQGTRVLDVACGPGIVARRLAATGASVSAVLAGSSGLGHDAYRAAFEASLHSHRLGVDARRSGPDIRFEYHIVAQAFTRTT